MDEQATVAPSPLALAGTDLEVQLGDAHVIERVMLIFRTLIRYARRRYRRPDYTRR